MTQDQRSEFANAVWDEFCRVTRQERLMGPTEFSLVRWWMDQDIPLRIVLSGIREVRKHGRSLLYYEQPVQARVEQWARGLTA